MEKQLLAVGFSLCVVYFCPVEEASTGQALFVVGYGAARMCFASVFARWKSGATGQGLVGGALRCPIKAEGWKRFTDDQV